MHVIPLGVRGFIPVHTTAALKDLGLRFAERNKYEYAVARMAKESAVGIVWSRRRIELDLPHSGATREKMFRQKKKELLRAFPPTGRPPGVGS